VLVELSLCPRLDHAGQHQMLRSRLGVGRSNATEVAQPQAEVEPVAGRGRPAAAQSVQIDHGVKNGGSGEQVAGALRDRGLARPDGSVDQQHSRHATPLTCASAMVPARAVGTQKPEDVALPRVG
jgi:hypothetical protein